MKIKLVSKSFSERIPFLAELFEVEYIQDCEEYMFDFKNEHGTGFISGHNFPDGVGLFIINAQFKEKTELQYKNNSLQFFFNAESTFAIKDTQNIYDLNRMETAINATAHNNITTVIIPANKIVKLVVIEIVRKEFFSKIECDLSTLSPELASLFKDLDNTKEFKKTIKYGLHISESLNRVFTNEITGLERSTFMESKAFELFSLLLKEYEKENNKPHQDHHAYSSAETDMFLKAKEILTDKFASPPTIKDLASTLGTNVNKLQKGFKLLFNTTLKNFVVTKRMETAKILLANPDAQISKVAEEVGYANNSYFSKVFKENFGILPKEYQKQAIKEGLYKELAPDKKKD